MSYDLKDFSHKIDSVNKILSEKLDEVAEVTRNSLRKFGNETTFIYDHAENDYIVIPLSPTHRIDAFELSSSLFLPDIQIKKEPTNQETEMSNASQLDQTSTNAQDFLGNQ